MKPENRIISLSSKLPNRLELAKTMQYNVVMSEYDAHHCQTIIISDSIKEFQVLRYFDIEIEPWDCEHYAYENLLTDEERKLIDNFEENNEYPQDFWNTFWDTHDMMECCYEFETGEYMQKWINLKTGQITILGKPYRHNSKYWNPYCRTWKIITPRMNFYKHFIENMETSGFYKDETVNPMLKKHGYIGINAFNWSYDCGDEDSMSAEAKFIKNHDEHWEEYLITMANGKNPDEALFKTYTMDEIFYAENLQEPFKSQYKSALAICKRNHYTPTDKSLWRDTIKALFELQKDLHNAFYVCPQDLQAAHDKWIAAVERKKQKEARERAIQQAKNDKELINDFEQRIQKFSKLHLTNGEIVIVPLMTIDDFIQEGKSMHNCVFTMKYYKLIHSLILSAKNTNGDRLATIEYDLDNCKIIQCRADQNKQSPFETQIADLIYSNWKLIKKLNNYKPRKKKTE